MYTVYIRRFADVEVTEKQFIPHDLLLHDVRTKDYHVLSPQLKMKMNESGSFVFTITESNPNYNNIEIGQSQIIVKQDDEFLWAGRPVAVDIDFYRNKTFTCEGLLGYIADSKVDYSLSNWRFKDAKKSIFFKNAISLATSEKRVYMDIENGEVKPKANLFFIDVAPMNGNYEWLDGIGSNVTVLKEDDRKNVLEILNDKIFSQVSAYFEITECLERENSNSSMWTVDIKSPRTFGRRISFGVDLLDYKSSFDIMSDDFFNAIRPLDKNNELILGIPGNGFSTLYTYIKNNKIAWYRSFNYLARADLIEKYGLVVVEKQYDIDIMETVKDENGEDTGIKIYDNPDKCRAFLDELSKELEILNPAPTIEIKAVDLHMSDSEIAAFKVGGIVMFQGNDESTKRGVFMPVTEIDIKLDDPTSSTITLNGNINTLTRFVR